jgi:aryl-alcohol dehydrogenase
VQISAAVLRDPAGAHLIESVHLDEPGPGELRVRIVGAGMCHTDLAPRAGVGLGTPPVIVGHEGAGVVEALGPGVSSLVVGDHVVLSFDSCGECANCRAGSPAYCDTMIPRNLLGRRLDGSTCVTGSDGEPIGARWFGQSSFATHCLATERNAVKIDPSVPLELMGPLGCGVQTGAGSILVALNVRPGSGLVIFGSGAVGLSALLAAVVAGATPIIAVDLQDARLALARELGATHTLRGDDPELVAKILDITGGGAQYSFDTTGVAAVMRTALDCLRMTGVCGYVAVPQTPLEIDVMTFFGKSAVGILEGGADPQTFIPHMIELWKQGRFPFDRLIETYPMSRINEAEQSSASGGTIKPVLLPGS